MYVFFSKCLERVEVLTLVGCHHGFSLSVMVITFPLVAGIATDFDDPSRCRKCKCHLPHELVAQKWCHFLVWRLRNTQVTTWVRMCRDASQSRRLRSKTLPWSTKRWDDVIFPMPESLSFNKFITLDDISDLTSHSKRFHRGFLSPASSTWTFWNQNPEKNNNSFSWPWWAQTSGQRLKLGTNGSGAKGLCWGKDLDGREY